MAGRVTRNGQITSDGLVWSVSATNRNSYPRLGAAWNDLSDFKTPGFLGNGPTFTDSGSFNFIRTDGTNDIIYPQITGTTKLPGFQWGLHWDLDWTVEVWITTTRYGATSYAYFYAQYNGAAAPTYPSCATLGFDSLTTTPRVYFNPSVNDGSAINTGLTFLRFNTSSMQHVAFTMRDGTELRTYLNGTLLSSGSYDFKNTGFGRVNAVETIQVDSQGKIWCGGTFAKYNDQYITYGLIRLNPEGTIVSNWNTGSINPLSNVGLTGCNHRIVSIELTGSQANLFGTFNQYKNTTRWCGMRVDATGSLLATANPPFNYGIIGRTNSAGKMYMGVKFSSVQSMGSFFSRREPDMSTFNSGFTSGSSANSRVYAIELDADEKPIIGGEFTAYSGSNINRIARINTNGTLDTTFNVGAGANNTVWTIATGSSNSVYIGGQFTTYSGSSVNRITKINSNGTRDTSFNVGTGFNNTVDFITTDSTGKVYVCGQFTTYSGSSTPYFVRLNTNGTIDTTFNVGTGFDRPVKAVAIAADDKIYVGGQFFNYSGSSANGIVSLNMDGTINTTFNYGTGFSRANDRPSQFTPTFAGNIIGYMEANWGEIRIYNKALTATEVLLNYSGSKGKYGL
jgi:uncharacterized delta-60 repeat protein